MKKNEIKWFDTEYCGSADETVQPVLVNGKLFLKPKNSRKMRKKFDVSITKPLTLWAQVEAENDDEAIKQAMGIAMNTPYEGWVHGLSPAKVEVTEA